MRFLSPPEWQDWCSEHGVPLREAGWIRPALDACLYHAVKLDFPKDSGEKVFLARELVAVIASDLESLLLLDDWAVWPSSQHMPLLTRFREALGEKRPLIDAPGHLFNASGNDDAVSIVAMSLLFFWDCYGISATGRDAFYVSHDEYCHFFSRDEGVVARVAEKLSDK